MITLEKDTLTFSFPDVHERATASISFSRTLRIPDDDDLYDLPPGIGSFPLRHVDDLSSDIGPELARRGGVAFPMYKSEAMWINFQRSREDVPAYPFAIKVAAGKINAISGLNWDANLSSHPQDYLVVPEQPWLDGFAISEGVIAQFVAERLGDGYSVEEQLTGKAEFGGIQIIAYPMKASVYVDELLKPWLSRRRETILRRVNLKLEELARERERLEKAYFRLFSVNHQLSLVNLDRQEDLIEILGLLDEGSALLAEESVFEDYSMSFEEDMMPKFARRSGQVWADAAPMGLSPGGKMRQQVFEDPYGIEAWDQTRKSRCFVTLLDAEDWCHFTGEPPKTKPPTAKDYTQAGLPWFDFYKPAASTLQGASAFSKLKSWAKVKTSKGEAAPDNWMPKTSKPVPLGDPRGSEPNVVREPYL